MNENFEKTAEQAAAFQKIWVDSASKMMQAAFAAGPNSAPPEILRQIRSGIFQALAESWEEFMRSPQFLEGMKQWMESAINFRKLTNDFMSKVRNEMQAPSRDDIDTILLNVHHIEKRLLDRLDELSTSVKELNRQVQAKTASSPSSKRGTSRRAAAPQNSKRVAGARKARVA